MSARVLAPPPHQGRVPHARPPGVRDGQQGAAGRTVRTLHCVVQVVYQLVQALQLALRPAPNAVPSTDLLEHRRADAKRRCRIEQRVGCGGGAGAAAPQSDKVFRWEKVHLRRPRWADGTAARSPECLATSSMALSEHADPLRPLTCARPPQGSSLFCDSTGTTRRVRVSLRGPLCSIHPPLDRAARAPVRPACVAESLSRRRFSVLATLSGSPRR